MQTGISRRPTANEINDLIKKFECMHISINDYNSLWQHIEEIENNPDDEIKEYQDKINQHFSYLKDRNNDLKQYNESPKEYYLEELEKRYLHELEIILNKPGTDINEEDIQKCEFTKERMLLAIEGKLTEALQGLTKKDNYPSEYSRDYDFLEVRSADYRLKVTNLMNTKKPNFGYKLSTDKPIPSLMYSVAKLAAYSGNKTKLLECCDYLREWGRYRDCYKEIIHNTYLIAVENKRINIINSFYTTIGRKTVGDALIIAIENLGENFVKYFTTMIIDGFKKLNKEICDIPGFNKRSFLLHCPDIDYCPGSIYKTLHSNSQSAKIGEKYFKLFSEYFPKWDIDIFNAIVPKILQLKPNISKPDNSQEAMQPLIQGSNNKRRHTIYRNR